MGTRLLTLVELAISAELTVFEVNIFLDQLQHRHTSFVQPRHVVPQLVLPLLDLEQLFNAVEALLAGLACFRESLLYEVDARLVGHASQVLLAFGANFVAINFLRRSQVVSGRLELEMLSVQRR